MVMVIQSDAPKIDA